MFSSKIPRVGRQIILVKLLCVEITPDPMLNHGYVHQIPVLSGLGKSKMEKKK